MGVGVNMYCGCVVCMYGVWGVCVCMCVCVYVWCVCVVCMCGVYVYMYHLLGLYIFASSEAVK